MEFAVYLTGNHKSVSLRTFAAVFYFSLLVNADHNEHENLLDVLIEDQMQYRNLKVLDVGGRGEHRRQELPKTGDFFSVGLETEKLICGETYSVYHEGYLYFQLQNPSDQACSYNFVGSRKRQCTVAMLCKGAISLAPGSSPGKCDKEYLTLADATIGKMTGCGRFSFGSKPRIPRNNGTDLFVTLKGSSPKYCVVFCVEELGTNRKGVKRVTRIGSDKNFKGLTMEKDCVCGKRNDGLDGRIVGGENALKFEFPWIASIMLYAPRTPFCAASLINDKYLLSAAHCFMHHKLQPNQIQVLMHHHVMDRWMPSHSDKPTDEKFQGIPGWNLNDETDESENSVRLDIEEIICHPKFSHKSFDFDVAILKLKTPLNLKNNKLVAPICLPDVKEWINYNGANMIVAGWGRPSETAASSSRIPQKLDVPYVNYDKCLKYSGPQLRHLCAGYVEGGKDACAGDSGGPLIYKADSKNYMLSGIVSAGVGCAREEQFGLYTDVQEIIQWIYQHTHGAKWCPRQ